MPARAVVSVVILNSELKFNEWLVVIVIEGCCASILGSEALGLRIEQREPKPESWVKVAEKQEIVWNTAAESKTQFAVKGLQGKTVVQVAESGEIPEATEASEWHISQVPGPLAGKEWLRFGGQFGLRAFFTQEWRGPFCDKMW